VFALWGLICLSSPLAISQTDVMYTQKFGLSDGLSSTKITHFFQDSRGIVWFGTDYGLNSYDGAQFKSYTKIEGLAHNYILGVAEDNLGNLWVRSGDFSSAKLYMTIYTPETDSFMTIDEYLKDSNPFKGGNIFVNKVNQGVNIIVEKYDDTFWFYELENKKVKEVFFIPSSQENIFSVNFAHKSEDGRYNMVLGKNGDERTDPRHFFYDYDPDSSLLRVKNLTSFDNIQRYNLEDDYIYICLTKAKDTVFVYDNDATFHSKINISNYQKSRIHTYKNQLVVFDDTNSKLLHYDFLSKELVREINCDATFYSFTESNMHRDKEGGIWFLENGNITRVHFDQVKFNIIGGQNEINRLSIRGISKHKDEVYFASIYGLYRSSNGDFVNSDLYRNVPELNVGATGVFQGDNYLFVATESEGLFKYSLDSDKIENYLFTDKNRKFLWQPFVDKNNKVWVGSEGLYTLDKIQNSLVTFTSGEFGKLRNSIIYYFHETSEGVWLCTTTGLYLVDLESEKILKHYNKSKEAEYYLPLDECIHLYEDDNDVFWIATKGNGLVKWTPSTGRYRSFTKSKSNLSHDIIYAVYADENNNLWMSSQFGLMKFDKNTEVVTAYHEEDGLANNEFNTTSHFQDVNGDLYLGTITGMVHFDPNDFQDKENLSPIVLTSAYRMNKDFDAAENILRDLKSTQHVKINPSDRYIDLEFAVMHFNKAAPIRFSYRILEFQDEWTYSDNGKVRLSGLPYGQFELELRAKPDNSNHWASYNEGIEINVKRPFYLTWWFLIGSFLFWIFGVSLFVERNSRKFIERQQELEQIVLERTEEIRLQAEELKVLDKVKNNFFANISHELRTPLTLILGPLSHILDSPEKLDDDIVRNQLLVMRRNGKSLLQLIEEILDLSKLEANKLELKEEVTNVNSFFEYIFRVFEPQFETLGIKYTFDNQVDSKLHILMDRNKMEKVLNNYLSNAIKFTPNAGSISLSLRMKEEFLRISVRDSGSGIETADLPHIFERFFQSQKDKKLRGGTGIGLALVKEFALLMNAKAYAESEVGKGSVFYFDLPVKKSNAVFSAISPIPEIEFETYDEVILYNQEYTILVVEDNYDMREFICNLLKAKYKTILQANNGLEALQIIREKQTDIHLIVSDVMMPELDGLELLKKVKEDKELSTIPFIMLTALAAERDKLEALTIGIDDYLTKPFSVPELLARINNIMVNASMRKSWWSQFKLEKDIALEGDNSQKITIEDKHLSPMDKKFIEDLKNYIEANPSKELLDVSSLAKTFLISIRHFNRKVKSITGLPPAKFVKEVQLQKARRMLEDNNFISVSEVAYSVGFYKPSTFTSLFKKRFGLVPSKYQKNLEHNN